MIPALSGWCFRPRDVLLERRQGPGRRHGDLPHSLYTGRNENRSNNARDGGDDQCGTPQGHDGCQSEIAAIKAHPTARTAIAPPTITRAALCPALPPPGALQRSPGGSRTPICWTFPTMSFRTVPNRPAIVVSHAGALIPRPQTAGHEAHDGGSNEGLSRMRFHVAFQVRHHIAHRVVAHVIGGGAQCVRGPMGELADCDRQPVRIRVECCCGAIDAARCGATSGIQAPAAVRRTLTPSVPVPRPLPALAPQPHACSRWRC